MLQRNCPVCRSSDSKFQFYSANIHGRRHQQPISKFSVYKCQKCQSIFLKNINISRKYYQTYYQTDYYQSEKNLLSDILTSISNHQKQAILKKSIPLKTISILDIGCGPCEFLNSLNKKHFRSFGQDINPESAKIAASLKIKFFNCRLDSPQIIKNKFDAVTLFHVLEHVADPQTLITQASELLKAHGTIMLSIPNNTSLGYKIGHQNWFHLDSPRHLFVPQFDSLKTILENTGFSNIKEKHIHFEFPLDLLWSVRFSPLKFIVIPLYPLFKFFDRETITIIATKL